MTACGCGQEADRLERSSLLWLLAINGLMFLTEAGVGWWAESAGLLADSLDMLADASVYSVALLAVGSSRAWKASAALLSGWLQIGLGVSVLLEIARRLLFGSEPISSLMMLMGCLALVANLVCLALLAKHRHGEVHMRASWIFSTNDVIANLGVIVSGALVAGFTSRLPDLLVGSAVAVVVIAGGVRIVREARSAMREGGS